MKAVILAAGMGQRLRPMTEKLPKGLIEIDGKTLLEYSIENLLSCGIRETVIVLGFLGEMIRKKLGNEYMGMKLSYVYNHEFTETGSMYSLSMVKGTFEDSILLLESDLLYEKKAIGELLSSPFENAILTTELINNGDDVFVCADNENRVIDLGKKINDASKNSIAGCLVGISKFSASFMKKLFEKAEEDYKNGKMNFHYEECAFNTGMGDIPLYSAFCEGLIWTEIDNEQDYKRAREEIYPKIYGKIR